MTLNELHSFLAIEKSSKFQSFNKVKNYYDRPQNRFWKVMDVIDNEEFYVENSIRTINMNGLKFYKKMVDRDIVFDRQQQFCYEKQILITDIVREVSPKTFNGIYDNFSDAIIDKCVSQWNTSELKEVLKKYQPRKIIINFKEAGTIPNISNQIAEIRSLYGDICTNAKSTSGAAGNNYNVLINEWKQHF